MIFWIFVILFLVFLVLQLKNDCWYDDIWGIFALVCFIIIISMIMFMTINHIEGTKDSYKFEETYTALVYKMESTTCRDEFGFLSKDIIDDVQEWNETIRTKQAMQDNFWVGIFYPNVYDEFELIDYASYNTGGINGE